MRNLTLEELASEFAALKNDAEEIKHLDANAALVKFLAHIHGNAPLKAKLPLCGAMLEDLLANASRERALLMRKWVTTIEEHNPRADVAMIELPDGPNALDKLTWPLNWREGND
ncbi:MAG: hypothetical protein ABL931_20245, partial [Usitatibacteraceae bacterium]